MFVKLGMCAATNCDYMLVSVECVVCLGGMCV